ncbi:helix-turn-helix domain-containing protein [Microbacterium sp. NPDC047426]
MWALTSMCGSLFAQARAGLAPTGCSVVRDGGHSPPRVNDPKYSPGGASQRCPGVSGHLHPQTVRYRLRQLRQLFGDAPAEPDIRLGLILALRAESLRESNSSGR